MPRSKKSKADSSGKPIAKGLKVTLLQNGYYAGILRKKGDILTDIDPVTANRLVKTSPETFSILLT